MSSLLDYVDSHVFGIIIESLHPRFAGKEVMDMRVKLLQAFTPADPANEDTKRHQEILDDTEILWPCAITPDPQAANAIFAMSKGGPPSYLKFINEIVLPVAYPDDAAEWVMKTFPAKDAILCLSVGDNISPEVFVRVLHHYDQLEFLLAFPRTLAQVVSELPDTLVEVKIPVANYESSSSIPLLAQVLDRARRADSIEVVLPPKPESWMAEVSEGLKKEGYLVEFEETDLKGNFQIKIKN